MSEEVWHALEVDIHFVCPAPSQQVLHAVIAQALQSVQAGAFTTMEQRSIKLCPHCADAISDETDDTDTKITADAEQLAREAEEFLKGAN